ncbi:hypothetical protein [Undibacterium sp.]|uniref:hypothetical protein n=1 Tax=Undibacterium sp. TaxID=1914977 RepID=UPI0025F9B18A|nr:hypothetical protein [Undibacterium sp.]
MKINLMCRGTLNQSIALVGFAILTTACSNSPLHNSTENASDWAVIQPYHHPIAGMGSSTFFGSITVPENQERIVASRALILALQNFMLSVVKPKLDADGNIPVKSEWLSDSAPLGLAMLSSYNNTYPDLKLAPAQYQLVYEGQYDLTDGKFRYKIAARLFQRGAIGNITPVRDDRYAGQFFVQRLATEISQQLHNEAGK